MISANRAGIKLVFMIEFKVIITGESFMRKISLLGLFCAAFVVCNDASAYDNERFRQEVLEGADVHAAKITVDTKEDTPIGELGMDVYQTKNEMSDSNLRIYIPTDMYVRGGIGTNLGFLSDPAGIADKKVDLSGGWSTQIGLGWNMYSYVRTELDFQVQNFGFSDLPDARATAHNFGGTLYFDFARRYITTGDVIRRRTVVPFMGLGTGIGNYKFDGAKGASGSFVAPRGILGLNIMLTDLVGVDLSYQYQMFIGNGLGWNIRPGGVQNLSDFMISFRMNF